MLSERQEKLLHLLIQSYLDSAEPISSDLLLRRSHLRVSPATIRNELQELTELGYVMQPHTSAGRIPTEKGYEFFAIWIEQDEEPTIQDYVARQIQHTKTEITKEVQALEQFIKTLEGNNLAEILKILELWNKRTTN